MFNYKIMEWDNFYFLFTPDTPYGDRRHVLEDSLQITREELDQQIINYGGIENAAWVGFPTEELVQIFIDNFIEPRLVMIKLTNNL